MNVDLEFLRIVEELGPLEGFDSAPPTDDPSAYREQAPLEHDTAYTDEARDCGNSSYRDGRPAGDPRDPAAPGPADRTMSSLPKWDPETGCWWQWHEMFGGWYPIPGPDA
jgi:hypothetical protein